MSEFDGIRYLHFGTRWVQGAMRISRPDELVLDYTEQMLAWLLFVDPEPDDRIGILGLGAGALLKYTLRHTPAQVETVERSEEHTSELQSRGHLVCRLLLEKKKNLRHNRYRALCQDL